MRPSDEVHALAARWRLALAKDVQTGAPGERVGRGTGSSLEFQDRRDYSAGDDVRHLDWRAYARTDQLFVRLYREEILPRVELVIDASRSMRSDGAKARLATDLTAVLAEASRAEGLDVRLIACGDDALPVERIVFEREGVAFESARTLAETAHHAHGLLRPGAVRVVLSDFLFPHDASDLVRTLARGAGGFALLQVLSSRDVDPVEGSALHLVDSEDDTSLDLVLDARAVAGYRRRLRALTSALQTECRRLAGVFCELTSAEPLATLCRDRLAPAQVLAPA